MRVRCASSDADDSALRGAIASEAGSVGDVLSEPPLASAD